MHRTDTRRSARGRRYMGGPKLSRQPVVWLVIAPLAASLTGCATTNQAAAIKRLQARAAYDRALQHVKDKEASPALTAVQEAITLDDSVPVYWNTLGWIYLQLGRPDIAFTPFSRGCSSTQGRNHREIGRAHV